ncbi:MAG: cysteine desulfurase-like protein [Anaerolineae bacterium]|nr:cysteine desulfurase-like protein [Anaerolineae bacterium]NUQ05191.1 cysteine desulfurase-like protein [Anaerolineae bacterium]
MIPFDAGAARAQFPALHHRTASGSLPVYFDNPAGTQVPQRVIDAIADYFVRMNANSGGEFATSRASDAMVRATREKLAAFLNAPSADEIVIGPNMTTLNFGLSRALAHRLAPDDEIVLTRMDHDANVAPWLRVAEDRGLRVKWVDIRENDCTLDLDTLEAALTTRTRLVATVHASNAVGTINPVGQIADMAHAAGALHVVDAVQSAPHIPIDVQAIGCDFLLCSSYKFFGPHAGILWGRYDLLAELPAYKVRPSKDKPPYRWETGTPAFELIAGIGATMDYLESIGGVEAYVEYERQLAAHLLEVLGRLPGAQIAGITDQGRMAQRVPTVVWSHERLTPTEIAVHLAARDIYVWDGNYYAVEIMRRLDKPDGMVRVGLAHYNTHEEIERLEAALREIVG